MTREKIIKNIVKIERLLESARGHYGFERDERAWVDLDDAFQNLNSLHYPLEEGMPIE